MKRARQNVELEQTNQEDLEKEKEGIDECGIIDWSKFREMKTLNYVLEQKGLGSLKAMAAMELDGEMVEEKDTRDPEEAAKELALTVKDWEDQYLRSVRISQVQKVKCQRFITNLINSSLTIKDAEDGIGTLSTSVIINSGDVTGRIIRSGAYKNSSINCLSCLREYLYSGNGSQVVQDILSDELVETCKCAKHSCGMDGLDQWTEAAYETDCTEEGNTIHGRDGESPEAQQSGLVDAIAETDEHKLRKRVCAEFEVPCKDGEVLYEGKNSKYAYDSRKYSGIYSRNSNIILLLCESSAFSESEAMEVLAQMPQGIEIICSKQYSKRIKNYVRIARILVFQESIKQRFERAKAKFERENEAVWTDKYKDVTFMSLKEIIKSNNIDVKSFAMCTYSHLRGKSGKKNNLFFIGPPSTGKTMLMNSLVECQFNFCRLTGLTPKSSFNFSGLLHSNACFMDECKLTKSQFEQWKLLASGMPMSTGVKYKDRCDVKKCILYTCSIYPIEMYCKVPMAKQAIDERTIVFNFRIQLNGFIKIPPHAWEKLWEEYGFYL